MKKETTINIPELRKIINALLVHAEKVNGPELSLNQDYYWDLPSPEIYDVKKEIKKIELIGSLCDDLEFLKKMENIEEDGPSLNMIHAAPLLRYIAEKVGR